MRSTILTRLFLFVVVGICLIGGFETAVAETKRDEIIAASDALDAYIESISASLGEATIIKDDQTSSSKGLFALWILNYGEADFVIMLLVDGKSYCWGPLQDNYENLDLSSNRGFWTFVDAFYYFEALQSISDALDYKGFYLYVSANLVGVDSEEYVFIDKRNYEDYVIQLKDILKEYNEFIMSREKETP